MRDLVLVPVVAAALLGSAAIAPAHAQRRSDRSFGPAPVLPVAWERLAHAPAGRPAPVLELPAERGRTAATALGASAGSLLGLVAGVYVGGGPFYTATGCCGDGWLSALMLGAAGGSAGSAAGAVLVGEHPWSRAVPASVLGAGVGILVGAAGGLLGDLPGALVGFSLGQGITTAVVAPEP